MRRGRLTTTALGLLTLGSALAMSHTAYAFQGAKNDDKPVVVLETTAGTITLELDRAKAPVSVANFLKYVDAGFYDGLAFHRVIPGFMIQGGGMEDVNNTLKKKTKGAYGPIKNESRNGLRHARGTLAMARTPDPESATSQFFINHNDNRSLDQASGGYTVFGKVIDGLDVVDAIAKVPTTSKTDEMGDTMGDVPVKPILIKSARRKP